MDKARKLRPFAIVAVLTLCLADCHKTPNTAPVEDKDLKSTVDISYANLVISDIEMICCYVGESDLYPKFYEAVPGTPQPTINRDNVQNYVFVSFNTGTKCMDGRVRSGTIVMYYGYVNPNAKYCHDYQFQGKVSLSGYQVDGWSVGLNNNFLITNKLSSSAFNPKTTNLSWGLTGDFTLNHPSDPSKNMHCNVNLTKTLANTSDVNVFSLSRLPATTWSLAVVEYQGTVFGETSFNVPFTYNINNKNPLVRDFTCYPDKIADVTTSPSLTVNYNEFHPFVKGLASFTTGTLYPREIAYGNEQSTFTNTKGMPLPQQCDNKGIVTIKGVSYAVDFED